MNEEQKALALALRNKIHEVYQWSESPRMPREWIPGDQLYADMSFTDALSLRRAADRMEQQMLEGLR